MKKKDGKSVNKNDKHAFIVGALNSFQIALLQSMEASVICHTRQSQSVMSSEQWAATCQARYGYDFQRIKNFRVEGFFLSVVCSVIPLL